MPSRRTTPSPTLPRPRINITGLWSTNTTPTEEHTQPVWTTNDSEAKKISDTIDQELKAEKAVRAATRRKQRRVLLL
ncbi:hypothetical protein FRC11_006283, partial [Ceratobasidium sp. 423]